LNKRLELISFSRWVGLGILPGILVGFLLFWWLPVNVTFPTFDFGIPTLDFEPEKVYWFTSRAAGIVAYLALTGSVAWGLALSSKVADGVIPRPVTYEMHQVLSLVGVGFSVLHIVILLGDRFIKFTWLDLVLPLHAPYRPVEVALGIVGFYGVAILTGSFYLRRLIGQHRWRLLHYLSFPAYVLVTTHGILSGTDTKQPAMQYLYLVSGAAILFLTYYRLLIERRQRPGRTVTRPASFTWFNHPKVHHCPTSPSAICSSETSQSVMADGVPQIISIVKVH